MKHIRNIFIGCLVLALSAFAWNENERQALNEALNDMKADVAQRIAPLRGKNLLMLPVGGDSEGFILRNMKSLLLANGLTVVEEDKSEGLEAIAKEFAWDERMNDIVLPESLLKFGSLKGAQAIVYGRVRELNSNNDRIYAELEFFATHIETRALLWGGVFAGRYVPGGNLIGGFAENPYIVDGIKQAFTEFDMSLKGSQKLAQLLGKNVAIISLAGDKDDYVTERTLELLTTNNGITTRKLNFSTLTQARAYIRDQKLKADAYLYGAIRDMHLRGNPEITTSFQDKMTTIVQHVQIEISLSIINAENEDVLWSKVVANGYKAKEQRAATLDELKAAAKDDAELEALEQEKEDRALRRLDEKELREIRRQDEKELRAMKKRAPKIIAIAIITIAAVILLLFILRGIMSNVKLR